MKFNKDCNSDIIVMKFTLTEMLMMTCTEKKQDQVHGYPSHACMSFLSIHLFTWFSLGAKNPDCEKQCQCQ